MKMINLRSTNLRSTNLRSTNLRSTNLRSTNSTILALAMIGFMIPAPPALAWGRFAGGIHPDHDPHWHRDPVVVHNTYVRHTGHGCVGCGVGAAALVGLV